MAPYSRETVSIDGKSSFLVENFMNGLNETKTPFPSKRYYYNFTRADDKRKNFFAFENMELLYLDFTKFDMEGCQIEIKNCDIVFLEDSEKLLRNSVKIKIIGNIHSLFNLSDRFILKYDNISKIPVELLSGDPLEKFPNYEDRLDNNEYNMMRKILSDDVELAEKKLAKEKELIRKKLAGVLLLHEQESEEEDLEEFVKLAKCSHTHLSPQRTVIRNYYGPFKYEIPGRMINLFAIYF